MPREPIKATASGRACPPGPGGAVNAGASKRFSKRLSKRLSGAAKPALQRLRGRGAAGQDGPAARVQLGAVAPQPAVGGERGALAQQHVAERGKIARRGGQEGARQVAPGLVVD